MPCFTSNWSNMYRDFGMQTLGSNPAQTGPEFPLAMRNRRRRVRQKVHTPAYASLNGPSSSQVHDLSEIVDISEEGMAIQAASPLDVKRIVNLCLDLSETRASLHTTGEVIWSSRSGRVGIHFPQMHDIALRRLKEWLFVNAIVACANYRAEQTLVAPQSRSDALVGDLTAQAGALLEELSPSPPDYTSVLAALAAVKREVELLGHDLDAALQLIASRARTFTRASGAAIALSEGADMICRASAGRDAPGLGTRLKMGAGFSGECIRVGSLLRCEDSEIDPRADRESCRVLGIRSMIAVPVRWGDAVIGLVEVFSPEPNAFSANDDVVLLRLAEVVATSIHRAGSPEPSPLQPPAACVDDEFPVETPADIVLPHLSRFRKILLTAAAATVLLAGSRLIGPWGGNGGGGFNPILLRQGSQPVLKSPASTKTVAAASNLEGLRRLAEQGDPIAEFAVGARYATGEDVPQDYTEAVRWFSLAAEQGHVVAQATLGAYYWAGRGVPQDLVKAYLWSVLAQAGGDEASKYRVAVLASRMSRSQIVAAQQQANDWIKQHQQESKNLPVVP
jgi:putative methionine-R-sulfoxide reductase with GAF domain